MKRYLTFYGAQYYPQGGMEDFTGDFDNLKDALKHFEVIHNERKEIDFWFDVYDTDKRCIHARIGK